MAINPSNPRNIPCPHCGHDRDADLNEKCPLCGSREYWLLGYNYSREVKIFIRAVVIITLFALVAFAAGAAFLIFFNFL